MRADTDGNILDNPPLADEIAQDPLLQSLKLIAWVADDTLLPRLGERGFPHWGIWAERNKAFQKDILAWLVHNQPGMASQVATRYCLAHASTSVSLLWFTKQHCALSEMGSQTHWWYIFFVYHPGNHFLLKTVLFLSALILSALILL